MWWLCRTARDHRLWLWLMRLARWSSIVIVFSRSFDSWWAARISLYLRLFPINAAFQFRLSKKYAAVQLYVCLRWALSPNFQLCVRLSRLHRCNYSKCTKSYVKMLQREFSQQLCMYLLWIWSVFSLLRQCFLVSHIHRLHAWSPF